MHIGPALPRMGFGTANTLASKVWFSNGPYAKFPYYLRVTSRGDANEGARIEINSGGGRYDQREIVDAGFLELVRLGIKPADDPVILRTLTVVDKLIKVETPGGSGGIVTIIMHTASALTAVTTMAGRVSADSGRCSQANVANTKSRAGILLRHGSAWIQ